MLVFRELRRTVESGRLIDALLCDLAQIQLASSLDLLQPALESSLIAAGQLECGIQDFQLSDFQLSNNAIPRPDLALSVRLSDLLARALLSNDPVECRALAAHAQEICQQLRHRCLAPALLHLDGRVESRV